MKKQLLSMLCLIGIVASLQAQTLSGKLTDEQNQPLAFANVVLLSLPDSAFVTGTISDEAGAFQLPRQEKGKLIRISSVGYTTVYKKVDGTDFGVIRMTSDAQLMGEVVVKGTLPTTRLKGDAMITGVTGTLLEKAGTAENLLNQIPNVTAQDGSVNVFGRGTPEIYINGRKVRNTSELDQLSSESVKSVEVVNNPGARYDASVKAVIRITTKKMKGEGFGFNNRLYFRDKRGYGLTSIEQFDFNYRKNGFDMNGMIQGNITKFGDDKDLIDHTFLESEWKQVARTEQSYERKQLATILSLNYQFNDKHSIGVRHSFSRYATWDWDLMTKSDIYQNGSLNETSYVEAEIGMPATTHLVNLYYNGKVKGWTIDLNADGLWKTEKEWQDNTEYITESGREDWQQVITTNSRAKNTLYAGKLVLSHALWKGNLAFGGEYSHNNRTNLYVNPQGIFEGDDSRIKEGSTSAFVEYARSFGKLNAQVGMRYEHVDFKYYVKGEFMDEQSKKYQKFFPSVALNFPVGKVQMQLSYAKDVDRPNYSDLRNNLRYMNRYTYDIGNPFLLPSYTDNVTLNSSYKWASLTIGYQYVKDCIGNIVTTYSEENPAIGVFGRTNLPSYDALFAALTLSPKVGLWRPQFNMSIKKQWYTGETMEGKANFNHPIFQITWRNAFKLPEDILLNIDGFMMSRGHMLHNYISSTIWNLDITVQKSFFKNRLNIQLFTRDLFETYVNDLTAYYGMRVMEYYPDARRQFGVTLRYNFNSTKSKYKGTGAGQSQKARM